MQKLFSIIITGSGCSMAIIPGVDAAKAINPGREYAPNMYHSVALSRCRKLRPSSGHGWRLWRTVKVSASTRTATTSAWWIYIWICVTLSEYSEAQSARLVAVSRQTVPKDSIPLVTKDLVSFSVWFCFQRLLLCRWWTVLHHVLQVLVMEIRRGVMAKGW